MACGLAHTLRDLEAIFRPVPRKIFLMRFGKTAELCAKLQIEGAGRDGSKAWRRNHLPIIAEADQPCIKCGVPQSRQEKAVVHVEPFGVAFALSSRG